CGTCGLGRSFSCSLPRPATPKMWNGGATGTGPDQTTWPRIVPVSDSEKSPLAVKGSLTGCTSQKGSFRGASVQPVTSHKTRKEIRVQERASMRSLAANQKVYYNGMCPGKTGFAYCRAARPRTTPE